LAMAVVGIGIAGIMALFVPALEASKESIAEDYSSQVATTLLAYIERQKKANWETQFTPPDPPDSSVDFLPYGPYDDSPPLTDLQKKQIDKVKEPLSYTSAGVPDFDDADDKNGIKWTPIDSQPNLFQVEANGSVVSNSYGTVYGLKIGDGSQFCAYARVWTENTTVQNSKADTDIPKGPSGRFVRIKVEIAWPATVPYERRQKRYYVLDLGKPQ
ncbi:MAG: hypothetical protein J6A21_08695, partial [Lentisphaeria bacterium]|nr:hypothetical protein [Lentisphaeria bacterium]